MRFYNIEMKGKLILEKPSSVPPYNPADEGRIFYYNDTLYYSDSTANTVLSTTGGGAASGNAAKLEGNDGNFYLCRDNHTGILPIEYGGTGATDSTGAIANLGLDSFYGGLNEENTWSQDQNYGARDLWFLTGNYCSRLNYRCLMMWETSSGACTTIHAGSGMWIRASNNRYACLSAGGGHIYYISCSSGSPGCGIFTVYTDRCFGVCHHAPVATILVNNRPNGAGTGVEVCNCGCCNAIWARNCSSYASICAEALGGGFAVSGNTAYQNTSSSNLKHLDHVCLSNCVRKQPLDIYKYYWEDTNNAGFNTSIGPTAEGFDKTFNIDNSKNGEDYSSVWSVDGVALGLSIENLKEIDKLKKIVVALYSCIQKLEGVEVQ